MATRSERARTELLLTAERLFATQGLDSVSLRQIASAAGYANPATIQYHFGSKAELCRAIVEHRLAGIERRRLELFAGFREIGARQLAEVMARPLLELDPTSHYAGFVGQLLVSPDDFAEVRHAMVAVQGGRRIRTAVDGLLADLSPAVRTMRLKLVTLLMVHAIASHGARAAAGRDDVLTDEEFERELLSALAAVLSGSDVDRSSVGSSDSRVGASPVGGGNTG